MAMLLHFCKKELEYQGQGPKVKHMEKQRRIILFGAGEAGQNAIKRLNRLSDCRVLFCVDNDPKKHGMSLSGLVVHHPSSIRSVEHDQIVIASEYRSEIMHQVVSEYRVPEEKIALAPDINDFSDASMIPGGIESAEAVAFMAQDYASISDDVLSRQMEVLFSKTLPYEYWLHVYHRLSQCGLLSAAYYAKTKAQSIELEHSDIQTQRDLVTRFLTLTELNRMNEAESVVRESVHYQNNPKYYNEILGNAWRISGYSQKAESYWTLLEPRPNNTDFNRLINGKRVAIVGAADSKIPNGQQIDGFDVVIRTNFVQDRMSREQESIYGRKTSITYLNTPFYLDHNSQYQRALERAEKEGVMICAMSDVYRDICRKKASVPSREFIRYPGVYRGTVFMVTSIVIDIMKYHPASITVYASDFFTGSKTHRPGYVQYGNYSQLMTLDDPLRNFEFAGKVFRAFSVESDTVLNSVMKLSRAEYISRFTGEYYRGREIQDE
jgi:hypothetical protein